MFLPVWLVVDLQNVLQHPTLVSILEFGIYSTVITYVSLNMIYFQLLKCNINNLVLLFSIVTICVSLE